MERIINRVVSVVKEIAVEVYSHLGVGFDEVIYQSAMAYELRQRGFRFQREVNIEIFYKGIPLGMGRPDFLIRPCKVEDITINEPILIELKTVEKLNESHRAQLRAYLFSIKHSSDKELKSCSLGLLINFPKKGSEIEIESITLPDGTKLVTIHNPIRY